MNAIKFETTVDERVAGAMPKLRPMLGRRVAVIAHETVPAATTRSARTLDDFLTHRLKRPADVAPVTLKDMERAIVRGALGGAPCEDLRSTAR